MKDFYQILGVATTADDATLKSAYRKLAKEYHPDTNKDPNAEAKFKEINEAYDTLKDANKRAQYDLERTGGFRTKSQSYWSNQPGGFEGSVNLDDILRDIQNRRARHYQYDAVVNRDIMITYAITLEEAFQGKDADVKYNLPGKEAQSIQFKIPAGIQDGIRLRFQGKGDNAISDIPPGDLYIRINIVPHNVFVRMGYHLVTSTTIDYMDAMLGAEREIPTIEGTKINMRVPAGIQPGQSLRAAGKGMPMGNGQRGDMMVEVVFSPSKLSDEQRELIEKARSLNNG
jgi:curved DNA-binding protein